MRTSLGLLISVLWLLIVLGALRIADRVHVFTVEPARAQKALLGRVVAGPTQLSLYYWSGGLDGGFMSQWSYRVSPSTAAGLRSQCLPKTSGYSKDGEMIGFDSDCLLAYKDRGGGNDVEGSIQIDGDIVMVTIGG